MTTSCNACVNILGWGGGQIVLKNPVREREEEEGWKEREREREREIVILVISHIRNIVSSTF